MKTYFKIRQKVASISKKIMEVTKLNRIIDLEFFDHFFVLGILLHSIIFVIFGATTAVLSAFVVGIGKEVFDKYVVKSKFSVRAAFLTIVGGVTTPVLILIAKDTPSDILLSVLALIVGFFALLLLMKVWSK